jgi:hypothetical protein
MKNKTIINQQAGRETSLSIFFERFIGNPTGKLVFKNNNYGTTN